MTINVLMKDLPSRLRAVTTPNADGTYTMFVNSRLNLEQQQLGYIHELEHILKGDYDKKDSNTIELEGHKIKAAPASNRNSL